jgi:phosphate transport system substrate-binding protein
MRALAGLCLIACLAPLRGQDLASLPPYRPAAPVTGQIGIWGDDGMKTVVGYWEEGFRRFHPQARFAVTLKGSSTGMAGVYSGVADLALLGREIEPVETMAFAWIFRYPPGRIEVANGSVGAAGKSPAVAVYLHRDNPLGRLTLAQLDAAFGCEHRRGAAKARTWGDLGLGGDWALRPIHLYGYDVETGRGAFIRRVVLRGSRKWDWDLLTEFSGPDADRQIVAALARDRFGIAVASPAAATTEVKAVGLAEGPAGPYSTPTRADLIGRTYPLGRVVAAYVNRAPGRPLDPKVAEFLRYILSREGQEDVMRERDYLPLSAATAAEQVLRLN